MVTRTKRVTLTFKHPFSLKGVDRTLAPGQYEVVSDEELIEELTGTEHEFICALRGDDVRIIGKRLMNAGR